jgi:hypothetical protein
VGAINKGGKAGIIVMHGVARRIALLQAYKQGLR